MYLENLNSLQDLKNIQVGQLNILAQEIRVALLKKLSCTGGHIGPNLGMVEATIALHYVFNSPVDKFVFDVSHQSSTHKILTGRKDWFVNEDEYYKPSPYTCPQESNHDFFIVGHTSTSISLACGLAKARDLTEGKENIIAIIGDGSLSGGEAYEGLNNIAEMNTNMIIIVNDNEMSVAENHGGLYKNLKLLRETEGKAENNFFKSIGLDYIYVKDGHDITSMINIFSQVKDRKHPTVVHIHTIKGKGYPIAENDKEEWHARFPFSLEDGKLKDASNGAIGYSDITADYLLAKMKNNPSLIAVTSGTPGVFGFNLAKRKKAGKQFIDVGIAEEHAVALSSGLAAYGAKPVYGVFSSFIQRTYDQLSQDLCINNNPATILVFDGSVSGFSDVTHLGFFDIPLISNIPNIVYLGPTCLEEYISMLDWAIEQDEHPVAIKVPGLGIKHSNREFQKDYSELNKYEKVIAGCKIAIIALGSFYKLGVELHEELLKENVNATLINPRYITGVDKVMLKELKKEHKLIITLEDGVIDGGFGEKITRFYSCDGMKVLNLGLKKEFTDRLSIEEILEENMLTVEQIMLELKNNWKWLL